MKIYELARELDVDREAFLFFAQNQKIEVKSIDSELTSDEVDSLLIAFDEAVVTSTEEKKYSLKLKLLKK